VERRRRPGDERAWGLHLTRKGEQLTERMRRRVLELDHKRTPGLTEKDRRQLLGLLGKIAK
jgi:DNA-binding MarR family transcriptional regulator